MDSSKKINIYTDGACKGNPGQGGWGALLEYNGHVKEISGYSRDTTNNIMELTAVIKALEALKNFCNVTLTTDSQYVKNGITEWIHNWKKNGWRTANKKAVKNQKLWMILDGTTKRHKIQWEWIKGHSGHPQNERADELANLVIEKEGSI